MRKSILLLALVGFGLGYGAWLGDGIEQPPVKRVVSNNSFGTVMDVTVPGVTVEPVTAEDRTYDLVSLPGEVLAALDVGKPQVPKISCLLGIPDRADVSVSVTVLERQTFENIDCYPYQTPLLDGANNPFVIDRAFYTEDKSYPGLDARVMNTGVWRELSVANIELYPVHYNPAQRKLEVYTRLRVDVRYTGGSYTHKLLKPWLLSTYNRWIDNLGNIDFEVMGTDNPGVKYLVIAHSNWATDPWMVDSLLGWHYQRGVETRLVSKSGWTAQEIKDSIRAEYARNDPAELRWVLLVGEFAQIPMYAMGGVGRSDYWYSDFLPSGTTDNYPEIGLSRISATDPTDMANQVKKILMYEKTPPATDNWLSKHSLIACSQDYPGKYSGCNRGIYNKPMGWWRYDFDTLMCQYHGNDWIANTINEGRSVVTYRGHGDIDQWYTMALQGGAPWYIANVNQLTNGDLTPAIFNIACLCGDIYQATCLSEAWMRKYPGGAAASFAATQASYTFPNHGICSTLVRSMCDTWTITVPGVRNYICPTWDMGWIQNNVDAYVAKYWPSSPYPDNIYMYLNLGDPAMEVWAGGQPEAPVVTYAPAIPVGPYDLPVSVTVAGNPVKNALVCLWKAGEFYVTGRTNDAGEVTLAINSLTPGEFLVTVSEGHAVGAPPLPILPFEGTCIARTSNTPYVVHLRHSIDDATGGNGDGIANPGETVTMPTWVKNLGQQSGAGITGLLRTLDASVTITDSLKSFGAIPANDSAFTGADGYKFRIGDTCSNGHNIAFQLLCRDANDSVWNSLLSVRVGTGILGYSAKRVNDPSGNNNGKIDPGEDAEVYVSLGNTGLGHAYNVRGILRSGNALFTITDSVGAFGTVPRDSVRECTDWFGVHADGSILPETPVPCTLIVSADGGYTKVIPFSLVIGEITTFDPIPDNATPTPIYWAYDNVDAGYQETPVYNWIEIRGRGTRLTLSDDQTVSITLPPAFGPIKYYSQRYTTLAICGNGFIVPGSFSSAPYTNTALPASAIAAPAILACWDDLYPPTGGGVWWFHDTANHALIVEWDSVSYYPSGSGYDKFQFVIYDTTLASVSGQNKIVVQYMTANGYGDMTTGIQDPTRAITIQCVFDNTYTRGVATIGAQTAVKYTTDVPSTGIAEKTGGLGRVDRIALGVSPNPFKGNARINWQVPATGRVSLRVFDISGRTVRTLCNDVLKPGAYHTSWNGTDDQGRSVAAGVYFYELNTSSATAKTKATLLR